MIRQQNTCGEAHFYGVRHTPLQGGGAPVLSNFGVPFYFGIHPLTPNDQIWCGRTCFHGSTLSQWRRVPSAPQFWGFPYNYVCVHPLS